MNEENLKKYFPAAIAAVIGYLIGKRSDKKSTKKRGILGWLFLGIIVLLLIAIAIYVLIFAAIAWSIWFVCKKTNLPIWAKAAASILIASVGFAVLYGIANTGSSSIDIPEKAQINNQTNVQKVKESTSTSSEETKETAEPSTPKYIDSNFEKWTTLISNSTVINCRFSKWSHDFIADKVSAKFLDLFKKSQKGKWKRTDNEFENKRREEAAKNELNNKRKAFLSKRILLKYLVNSSDLNYDFNKKRFELMVPYEIRNKKVGVGETISLMSMQATEGIVQYEVLGFSNNSKVYPIKFNNDSIAEQWKAKSRDLYIEILAQNKSVKYNEYPDAEIKAGFIAMCVYESTHDSLNVIFLSQNLENSKKRLSSKSK